MIDGGGRRENVTTIYALAEPGGPVRYIGKTVRQVTKRLSGHLSCARRANSNHRSCWLKGLLKKGIKPIVIVLCQIEGDGCEEERYQIRLARMAGISLTNHTDGGERGFKMSEESRRRMSNAAKGRPVSLETRQRKSAEQTGRKLTPEWKAKVVAALSQVWRRPKSSKTLAKLRGRPVSQASRMKMSLAQKRRPAGTRRRKMSQGDVARLCERYRAGERTVVLAAEFGLNRMYVTELLRRNGVPSRPHSLTPEQIEKMRRSKTGVKQSPEVVAKRAAALRGYKHSPETIAKFCRAAKARVESMRERPG